MQKFSNNSTASLTDSASSTITANFIKINVKEKGKVYDNTAKMQFINQLGA